MPRTFVVDACVAVAASERANLPAARSRAFLERLRSIGHRVAMNPALRQEWLNNASRFSTAWLAGLARRGRVNVVALDENAMGAFCEAARDNLDAAAAAALIKDAHIFLLALACDERIASTDDSARAAARRLADTEANAQWLLRIAWANPVTDHEAVIDWLANNAPIHAMPL